MTLECKDTCNKLKVQFSNRDRRYGNGRVYCRTCDVFIEIKDCLNINSRLYCTCCHTPVRTRPRRTKHKINYKISKEF